jgi:uncharacterized protein
MPANRTPSAMLAAAMPVVLIAIGLVLAPAAHAGPTHYVTVSDGTQIAINIRMPDDFVEGRSYPTVFEMSGYDGGSSDGDTPFDVGGEGSRGLTEIFNEEYVTIHASVRGTGCSSGEFDLFSWRSALDGREVIEWITTQPWSDGKVGLYGHSYGGITGFMIAATQPEGLEAASLSGLIDDLYRGIVYPGGVSNYGFPLLWTGGIRNVYDIGGGSFDGIVENQDQQCARNTASHSRTILNDPIVQGLSDTDNTWYQVRSLINYAERIQVPIHIAGAHQDEQTGPRGPYHLFEAVRGVPKRLLMSNGDHGTQTSGPFQADRKAWMDHWLRGVDGGFGSWRPEGTDPEPPTSVRVFFEMGQDAQNDYGPNGTKDATTFPLEDTDWTNVYLRDGNALSYDAPTGAETGDQYFSGSPRQSWSYQAGPTAGSQVSTADGPDEVEYRSEPFAQNTALAGPITATLFSSSTAVDTEFFVQLIDEAPDGSRSYLQRGMLKASHRAYMPTLSDKLDDGTIYRPHRPHTNPTNITPNEVYEYLIEVFPVSHVFREGHRLVVKVHTPPAVDSYYAYVPKRPAGINTIYHDADRPSRLMLPVIPLNDVELGPERACDSQDSVRCIPG